MNGNGKKKKAKSRKAISKSPKAQPMFTEPDDFPSWGDVPTPKGSSGKYTPAKGQPRRLRV